MFTLPFGRAISTSTVSRPHLGSRPRPLNPSKTTQFDLRNPAQSSAFFRRFFDQVGRVLKILRSAQ